MSAWNHQGHICLALVESLDMNIGMNLLATFWKTSWKDFHMGLGRTHFKPVRSWDQWRVGDLAHQGGADVPGAHYTRDRETP